MNTHDDGDDAASPTTHDADARQNSVPDSRQDTDRGGEPFRVAEGISVPSDSNIVGGGKPGDAVDIGTASGPSDSGGG